MCAPTSLEMFMPKQSWSKETRRRLSQFVTQSEASQEDHTVALDWAFDTGVRQNMLKNRKIIEKI